ncbi:MAG TPA: AI-2E family transporter [Chloroflexota bacterium]|nr:AI-2E family transporter [Chloroflexota bacterium]
MATNAQPNQPDPPPTIRFDLLNVALAAAVVILVIQAFRWIDVIQGVVVLFLIAVIFATALEPLVFYLHGIGVGRAVSVLLIYLGIVAVIAIFLLLLINALMAQMNQLAVALPRIIRQLGLMAGGLPPGVIRATATSLLLGLSAERIQQEINTFFNATTITGLLFATLGILEALFALVTVLVIAYFWIAERITIRRFLLHLVKPEERERALAVWQNVELKVGQWARGQLLLMLTVGVLEGVGFAVLGVPFALLLGVYAGLVEIIPILGPYLGAIPAILIALTQSPTLALLVAGWAIIVNLIEGNILFPRIMQETVGLSPLTVILALLAGANLNGVLGALLAVPIAAAIQAVIQELMAPYPAVPAPPVTTEPPKDRAA